MAEAKIVEEQEIDLDNLDPLVREIMYRVFPNGRAYVLECLGQLQEQIAHAVLTEMSKQDGESSTSESPTIRPTLGSGDAEQRGEGEGGSPESPSGTGHRSSGATSSLRAGSPAESEPLEAESRGSVIAGMAASDDQQGAGQNRPRGSDSGKQDASSGEQSTASSPSGGIDVTTEGEQVREQEQDERLLRRNEQVEGDNRTLAPNGT